MQKRDFDIWWIGLILVFGLLLLMQFFAPGPVTVPYSTFHSYLEQGQVKRVLVGSSSLEAELKNPTADGHSFVGTVRIAPDLYEDLAKYGVEVSGKPEAGWIGTLAGWLLPMLAFFGIWWFMLRRMSGGSGMGGGLLGIGKSKAKIFVEQGVKTSFEDVAGVEEAKAELHEIVEFLKKPEEYGRLGAHIPRGVLLVGPPGTGKTMLARAVAGEAGVPFFSTNGSEFVEMFVGVGAARVRDLFEQARQNAPCIIFIDEIDALGRARGIASLGGADEKEQTLNQLLAEMDGFDRGVPMVLLAATNRPEILDPALLRAGRFDRQVLLDRPDKRGRAQILHVYLKKLKLAADVDVEGVAALTPGFTGADIANLANEAAVVATRRGADSISAEDFTAAIERIIAGLEKKSRIISPAERRIVAYHEMGHALVAMAIPGCDPVQKVSIIPRGIGALGFTMQRPLEDRFLMTRSELDAKMTVLLGGRAAELIALGECSTGAQDDLAKATDIARAVALRYGLEEKLGPVAYDTESGQFLENNAGAFWRQRRYSEATAREIDEAVHAMLDKALRRAQAILMQNRAELEAGTAALLEKETLTGDDLPRPRQIESASTGPALPQPAVRRA